MVINPSHIQLVTAGRTSLKCPHSIRNAEPPRTLHLALADLECAGLGGLAAYWLTVVDARSSWCAARPGRRLVDSDFARKGRPLVGNLRHATIVLRSVTTTQRAGWFCVQKRAKRLLRRPNPRLG